MISPGNSRRFERPLHIACVSDIHLGHPRTHTLHILNNLRAAFPDTDATGELDLILIAGDVFDRLLSLPQEIVEEIQAWIYEFLGMCARRNILVRVLEGTPSHDWRQSRQFRTLNQARSVPANLRYVETLSIETIPELDDLTVLYVPDEWNEDADVTWRQVVDLLATHGLEQVDVACMHGCFDYQLPVQSIKCHNSERYQSIVRHFVFIGHVHIRSENGKILAQGSFDRTAHGEEAPKGHYRVWIGPEGDRRQFVENPGAKPYLTLDCLGLSLEAVLELLKLYEHLPDDAQLRLLLSRDSTAFTGIHAIRQLYPQWRFTTQLDELNTQETSLTKDETPIPQPIQITPHNVMDLVMERVPPDTPSDVIDRIQTLLTALAA